MPPDGTYYINEFIEGWNQTERQNGGEQLTYEGERLADFIWEHIKERIKEEKSLTSESGFSIFRG